MVLHTNLNEVGFFEGTEKLLEIWFDIDNDGSCDLRRIPRVELDSLLKIVNAEIVSYTHNEFIDSYVLSESSMFISQNRFIIKTCGITKLLLSVQPIINLARKYGKMNKVHSFFYSRRVYLHPEEQLGVHKTFQTEVQFLQDIIPEGKSYEFGEKEREKWYLFSMINATSTCTPSNDVTLEILMSDLDEGVMANFTKLRYDTSDELAKNTGISRLIPGSMNDGLVFDPIGYSLNGLYQSSYYTIHVTPQPMCSYVSFETNLEEKNYTGLINRVLKTFKPGKFIVTLFSNKEAKCGNAKKALDVVRFGNYHCDDQHYEQINNYSLDYRLYVKY